MNNQNNINKIKKSNNIKLRKFVILAILISLVIVLQLLSTTVKIGQFNFSFVIIPIVLGGIFLGLKESIILGGVFGIMCIISGLFGLDAGTLAFLQINPTATIIICMVKAMLAAILSTLFFDIFYKMKEKLTIFGSTVAAIVYPIVNTGIFLIGYMLFFNFEGLSFWVLLSAILVNFLFELITSIILVPTITFSLKKYIRF